MIKWVNELICERRKKGIREYIDIANKKYKHYIYSKRGNVI